MNQEMNETTSAVRDLLPDWKEKLSLLYCFRETASREQMIYLKISGGGALLVTSQHMLSSPSSLPLVTGLGMDSFFSALTTHGYDCKVS